MKKNILIFKIALLFLLANSNLYGQIVIENADFEIGNDGQVESWETGCWRYVDSLFSWEEGSGRNNSNCITITVNEDNPNDAWFYQTVSELNPNSWYKLTGWMKGENVVPDRNVGAIMSNAGSWVHSVSLEGTFDWTELTMKFKSDSNGCANIACRIGFWGNVASGKIWFDDVSIEEQECLESQYLTYIFDDDDLTNITTENLNRWFAHMDSAYVYYNDLTGFYPYSGDKIGILSVAYYPGGLAIAGNPILWYKPFVGPTLKRINDEDEWSFAMLHEIGHDFDDNGWNFDGEVFANFKMYYILEMLNAKVWVNNDYYIGTEVAEIYQNLYDQAKEEYLQSGEVNGYGGALLHRLIELKNEIGWEAHKQTFRYLYSIPDSEVASSRVEKYFQYIELLSEYSGEDVYNLIPQDDMNEFVAYLGDGYVNQIPIVHIGKDTVVSSRNVLNLNPVCSDDNYPNEQLIYQWKELDGNDGVIISDSYSKDIQITFSQKGTFNIELKVWDGQSRAFDTIRVTAHEKPSVYIGNDTLLTLNDTFCLYPLCSDDGFPNETLNYSWIQLGENNGLSIQSISDKDVEITALKSGVGKLVLDVFDGHLSASDTIQIVVNGRPKVCLGVDTIVKVEESFQLNPECSDDGYPNNNLNYTWESIGDNKGCSLFDMSAKIAEVEFTDPGKYYLVLNVSDGLLNTSDTVSIIANSKPEVSMLNDTVVAYYNELIINPLYSDDGYPFNELVYEWTKISNSEDFELNTATNEDVKVSFHKSGIYLLSVRVSDGHRVDSDTIAIIANESPYVYIGNDTIVDFESSLHLIPTFDDDGYPTENLNFAWSESVITDGLEFACENAAETLVTFNESGNFDAVLNVDDGHLSASDTINIIANQKPSVDAGNDTVLYTYQSYIINGNVSDDKFPYDELIIKWKVLNDDDGLTISDSSIANPEVLATEKGVYYLEFQANDGHRISSDTVCLTVEILSNIENEDKVDLSLAINPNPVISKAQITISLFESKDFSLEMHDNNGLIITDIHNNSQPLGEHSYIIDTSNLPSGIYYITLRTGDKVETKRMIKL